MPRSRRHWRDRSYGSRAFDHQQGIAQAPVIIAPEDLQATFLRTDVERAIALSANDAASQKTDSKWGMGSSCAFLVGCMSGMG